MNEIIASLNSLTHSHAQASSQATTLQASALTLVRKANNSHTITV
jgi:hypothetical protein